MSDEPREDEGEEFLPADEYACKLHAPWAQMGWIAKQCDDCRISIRDRFQPQQDVRDVEL